MKTIRIGFSTPKKFKLSSAMIRLYEKTKYSHVFIVMAGSNKLPFEKVFQASHGDVNCMTYEMFKEDNKIFAEYSISIDESTYYSVATWLWFQLQKPYSIMQLVRIVFNVKIKQNNDSAFICSELAGRLLEQFIGVNISKALDYLGLNDIKEILDDLALEDENINQVQGCKI